MKYLVLALLLIASPVGAAITHIGSLGTANPTAAATTTVITTAATLEAGNVAIAVIALDNACVSNDTPTQTTEVTGVADSAANTYTRLREVCVSVDGVGAGSAATLSIWVTKATAELATGGTITFTHASQTARAARAREFTVAAGNSLKVAGTPIDEFLDGTDATTQTLTGLPDKEYLFLRLIGRERADTTAITLTANYTAWVVVCADNGGADATSMWLAGEFRILTLTGQGGDTSDPTIPAVSEGTDGINTYLALEEYSTLARPVSPIMFQ